MNVGDKVVIKQEVYRKCDGKRRILATKDITPSMCVYLGDVTLREGVVYGGDYGEEGYEPKWLKTTNTLRASVVQPISAKRYLKPFYTTLLK